MKAGQSLIEVGQKVKIVGIIGEDSDLNGKIGTATHPFAFGCTKKGWIGVYEDAGEKYNIEVKNIEVLQ